MYVPQRLKPLDKKALTAPLKRCSTQNQDAFSAAFKAGLGAAREA